MATDRSIHREEGKTPVEVVRAEAHEAIECARMAGKLLQHMRDRYDEKHEMHEMLKSLEEGYRSTHRYAERMKQRYDRVLAEREGLISYGVDPEKADEMVYDSIIRVNREAIDRTSSALKGE